MTTLEYWGELISIGGTLAGTLGGVLVGYWLSNRSIEQQFRRSVLMDIAFEYRRLGNAGECGGVQGLVRAGICQCMSNREFECVLNLIDDPATRYETGVDWRPSNRKFLEFFSRIRTEKVKCTDVKALHELKARVEAGLPSATNQ